MRRPTPHRLTVLRARAEQQLAARAAPAEPASDALALLHELQVHQVELQMQNETLLSTCQVLEGSLARQRRLYDEAPVGYCTVDAASTIVDANPMAANLLRCGPDGLPGRQLKDLLSGDGAAALLALLLRAMASPTVQVCEATCRNEQASEQRSPAILQIEARHEPESRTTLVALIDISERKQAEALARRAEVAEQANLAKSVFFAQMNHELRTPLNAVLGFSNLLQKQRKVDLGDDLRKWVAHIETAGRHMLALISEGLDLARIESGHLDVPLEPVSMDIALAQALAQFESMATAQAVTLRTLPGAQGTRVLAVPRYLQQILANLLSNAIKYNRRGGSVTVSLRDAGGRVLLDVADTGPGLDHEQLGRLFRPFDRLGAERTAVEGTGLGLLISRRLAQAMHGDLSLRSERGEGSTATLVLPTAA